VSDEQPYEPIAAIVQASELLRRAFRDTAETLRLPDTEDLDTLGGALDEASGSSTTLSATSPSRRSSDSDQHTDGQRELSLPRAARPVEDRGSRPRFATGVRAGRVFVAVVCRVSDRLLDNPTSSDAVRVVNVRSRVRDV